MAALEKINEDQIYRLTRGCKDKFQSLLSRDALGSCGHFVSSQHKSFRTWIASIGALASPAASLDHRLREHGHIKLAVVELLLLVEDCLNTEPCQTKSSPEEHGGRRAEAGEPEAVIGQHAALEEALECLHQLASSIRRASAPNPKFDLSSRFSKKGGEYDPNFESFAKLLVKYRFSSASETLCEQLGTAMSRRRDWLLYSYRHAQKLSIEHERGSIATATTQPTSNRDEIGPSQTEKPAAISPPAKHSRSAELQTQTPLSAYSETVGSRLSVSNKLTNWQAPSAVSSQRTGMSLRNDLFEYPPIPKFDQDDTFCLCPYCFRSLRTGKLTMSYWRRHYDDDIRPFVCLSEECDDPPQFFSRIDAWERHMVEQHSEDWAQKIHASELYCDIGDCRSKETIFYSRDRFEEHMKSKPGRNYSATQISALMLRKQRRALREATKCPLCETKVRADSGSGLSLKNHVGGHLHYLASLCIPQMDASGEGANSVSQSVGKATEGATHEDSRDSKVELLAEAEMDLPLFWDEDRTPEPGATAAETEYMAPESAGLSCIVNRLAFMAPDYDPLKDAILQHIAKHQPHCDVLKDARLARSELEGLVMNRLIRSALDGREFLPVDDLEALVTRESVTSELRLVGRDAEGVLDFILGRAKRVFLTLLCIDRITALDEFQKNSICDEHLPFDFSQSHAKAIRATSMSEGTTDPYEAFTDWSPHDIDLFCEKQWVFLAPVFGSDKLLHTLHPRTPLPFIERIGDDSDNLPSPRSVYRVLIHPAHQRVLAYNPIMTVEEVNVRQMVSKEEKISSIFIELDHQRIMKPVALYRRGETSAVISPWARGGDLREFWATGDRSATSDLPLGEDLIFWAIDQMRGLASGLEWLHARSIRLGDLMPEHILHFTDGEGRSILAIASSLLGKTEKDKGSPTTTDPRRYQAPDFDYTRPGSRADDIWALGVICLEFLIWLVGGEEELNSFARSSCRGPLWEISESGGHYIQPPVLQYMDRLSGSGLEGSGALRSVFDLTRRRLLAVRPEERPTAPEVVQSIAAIVERSQKDRDYLFNAIVWERTRLGAAHDAAHGDTWKVKADDDFARQIYNEIGWGNVEATLTPPPATMLCGQCKDLNFWEPAFNYADRLRDFKERASACQLCKLLYETALDKGWSDDDHVEFHRAGSTLRIGYGGPRALSIYGSPDSLSTVPLSLRPRLGLPLLPKPGSREQLAVLEGWLRSCNESHGCMRAPVRQDYRPPARMVEIGGEDGSVLKLVDEADRRGRPYVALSHLWGKVAPRAHTTKSNYAMYEHRIEYYGLPKHIQDAILITRALGLSYLWVDLLCVINDDLEDVDAELSKIVDIFNQAFFRLAIPSAESETEGLLGQRNQRPAIAVRTPGGPTAYICKYIDNFEGDVEDAPMSREGWALQERVFCRRSIYFTPNQVYWECGEGIRCETLAAMSSPSVRILGDSNFPTGALKSYKGAEVAVLQKVYETYSGLQFSRWLDKPVAIKALEERLLNALETPGGYGVVESFLHRTLLWQRRDLSQPLLRIEHIPEQVPSWSWTSLKRGIKYMVIPSQVQWDMGIVSPFRTDLGGLDPEASLQWQQLSEEHRRISLLALGRKINVSHQQELLGTIIFDRGSPPPAGDLETYRGIILGQDSANTRDDPKDCVCYVLIVRLKPDSASPNVYERVGAGRLTLRSLSPEGASWIYVQ